MDNWVILKDAANIDAAYNFMNYILEPDGVCQGDRVPRLQHGGARVTASNCPPDTQFLDMVYFTDEEVSRMVPGSLDNQDEVVDIYNKVKAAAGA